MSFSERTREALVKSMLKDVLPSALPFVGMSDLTITFESIRASDSGGKVFPKSNCSVNVNRGYGNGE